MNNNLLNVALSGFGVKRHHTMPYLTAEETVGHHTAGVVALIFCMYDQAPPLRLVEAALYHDVPEGITGDIPATAKWDFPRLREASDAAEEEIMESTGWTASTLTSEEYGVLKFADMFHYVLKAHAEVYAGNAHMMHNRSNAIEACISMLHNNLKGFAPAHDLFERVLQEIRNAE